MEDDYEKIDKVIGVDGPRARSEVLGKVKRWLSAERRCVFCGGKVTWKLPATLLFIEPVQPVCGWKCMDGLEREYAERGIKNEVEVATLQWIAELRELAGEK